MIIKSLELKNFRNYESLELEPSPGVNIIYGENAQGKTNILEAVYVCATTKSHRSSKDKELIRFGCEDAHICMKIERSNVLHKIDMHLKRNKVKGVAVDGIVIKRYSELFGVVNVVLFSPEDLSIIKNSPAGRRHFIDMELCQLNKLYMQYLIKYNKIVLQRNNLLKQIAFDRSLKETLDIWDMQLAECGRYIISERRKFVQELGILIAEIHEKLSGGREQLVIKYEPNVTEDAFLQTLSGHRDNDLRLKTTTVGPHRDDISFEISGIDIRKYGSQGQQRTAALSLKLAEIRLVKQLIHDQPILLLDDVLSELDNNRQNYLLESIEDIQTMVTCTGLDDFVRHRFDINKVFKVVNGSIEI